MRVFREKISKLERADSQRTVERKIETEAVAAEAAEITGIVALLEARALLEEIGDRFDRQERCDEKRQDECAVGRNCRDPNSLSAGTAAGERDCGEQDRANSELRSGAAGE